MNSQNEQEFAKRERKRTEIEARLSVNIGSAERIRLENQLRGINRLQTQLLERAIQRSDGPQREVLQVRLDSIIKRQAGRSGPATASTGAPLRNTPSRGSPTGTVEFDDSPPVSGVRSPGQTGPRREPEQTPRPATRGEFDTARRNLVEQVAPILVGQQRSDTASADAVMSDRGTAGTDWNTQFEHRSLLPSARTGSALHNFKVYNITPKCISDST